MAFAHCGKNLANMSINQKLFVAFETKTVLQNAQIAFVRRSFGFLTK
jgi:hypothetical protein